MKKPETLSPAGYLNEVVNGQDAQMEDKVERGVR
jgi:hypothetical protein